MSRWWLSITARGAFACGIPGHILPKCYSHPYFRRQMANNFVLQRRVRGGPPPQTQTPLVFRPDSPVGSALSQWTLKLRREAQAQPRQEGLQPRREAQAQPRQEGLQPRREAQAQPRQEGLQPRREAQAQPRQEGLQPRREAQARPRLEGLQLRREACLSCCTPPSCTQISERRESVRGTARSCKTPL